MWRVLSYPFVEAHIVPESHLRSLQVIPFNICFLRSFFSQKHQVTKKGRRKGRKKGRKHCWDLSQSAESNWPFWASLGFVTSSSLIQRLSPLISSDIHPHSSHTWDNEKLICKQLIFFLSSAELFFFNSLKRKRLHQGERGIFNIVCSIKYAALVSCLGDAM